MLVYRVFFYDPDAKDSQSGHPLYLHSPQGRGRWDNPDLYRSWYFASSPEGAVGETFGNLNAWTRGMFRTGPPALTRALATFSIPDELALFNFDDATNLLSLGMRPSEVVIRNKAKTQRRAAGVLGETNFDGSPRWQGLQWWSFHHPLWVNLMLWERKAEQLQITVRDIAPLGLRTPAVIEAATILKRPLPRNPITVYVKKACAQSNATLSALDKAELDYETIDVHDDPRAHKEINLLGYSQAPVVVTSDGHWSGFRPDRIIALR